jgi:hypothetical protein
MKMVRRLQKNNGSTLTLVLFMLFLLSTVALAVMALTSSELGMSVMTTGRSKALLAAQAGAERAAQILDAEVAKKQDEARVAASQAIKARIDEYAASEAHAIPETSIFYNILEIDKENTSNTKVLNEAELNNIYSNEYRFQFNRLVTQWFSEQTGVKADGTKGVWNGEASYSLEHSEDSPQPGGETITIKDGTFSYSNAVTVPGSNVLSTVDAAGSQLETKSIRITSTGEYNQKGHTYKRSITAEFSLLTDSNGSTSDIPISYSKLTKVRVNKDDKPDILMGKAVIAGGNIISANGSAEISGNAVCFGTVPRNPTDSSKADYTADGYKYGGIMAGMTYETWDDVNLGDGRNSLRTSIKNAIHGISDDYFRDVPGSFVINGNAATSAYIHTLFGLSSRASNIKVNGSAFARSVKIENRSHFSQSVFTNVYTTDDLRIDANNASVEIGGWTEDINNPQAKSGKEGELVGLDTGSISGSDNSSAVVVSGDSDLYINGSIYIGGTTYFNEYKNDMGKMYFSGISVLKSGSLPAEAFEMWSDISTPSGNEYPGNVFYLYDNLKDKNGTVDREDYTFVNDPEDEEQQKLISSGYKYLSPNEDESENGEDTDNGTVPGDGNESQNSQSVQMMIGSTGIPDPMYPDDPERNTLKKPVFNIMERAMHFKWIWDTFWKDDLGYYSYLNSGDIKIVEDGNKLKGWCFGAVAANNKVYGPYSGFTESEKEYSNAWTRGTDLYKTGMSLFIEDDVKQLTGVAPGKKLSDSKASGVPGIINTSVMLDRLISSESGVYMLNSSRNVVLSSNHISNGNVSENLSMDEDGNLQGIIYSAGDIYVEAGTHFKGILIAEGSIVFLGSSDITYDENTVDILLAEVPDAGRLFNYSASDIILSDSVIKTIKRKTSFKNIKIIAWKEV